MSREYLFEVGPSNEGKRLDVFLQLRLPQELSRVMIQRAIREGHVLVNDASSKANHRVHSGEIVKARIEELPPKPGNVESLPEAIPIEVIFEDEAVLVVNKPQGLVTHPAPGHWEGTLVNAVLWHLEQGKSGASEEALPRAGIVHRLDKDTSGLLIIAKTARAHHVLAKALKERTLKRGYVALVDGLLPYDEGSIDAAIGRHATQRKEMSIQHLKGRSAVTHYQVVKRFDLGQNQIAGIPVRPYTLVDIELETGRTHQIRVHFAHIGHPVLGDSVYGKSLSGYWKNASICRQLLHAWRMRFQHPTRGHPVVVYAPLADDMRGWVDAESLEWMEREIAHTPSGHWRKIPNRHLSR